MFLIESPKKSWSAIIKMHWITLNNMDNIMKSVDHLILEFNGFHSRHKFEFASKVFWVLLGINLVCV